MGSSMAPLKQSNSPVTPGLNDQALFGLLCVVVACVLSGFSGIYFEKILKTSDLSLWMKNIQLAVLSVPISAFTMLVSGKRSVWHA